MLCSVLSCFPIIACLTLVYVYLLLHNFRLGFHCVLNFKGNQNFKRKNENDERSELSQNFPYNFFCYIIELLEGRAFSKSDE